MTLETLTNPFFLAAYLCAIIALAALIAFLIITFEKWQTQKTLNTISAKYAERKLADEKHNTQFMAGINAMTKESDAKLLAMKNCPKWEKLKQEINSEYAAMITGRNQFNVMMNR